MIDETAIRALLTTNSTWRDTSCDTSTIWTMEMAHLLHFSFYQSKNLSSSCLCSAPRATRIITLSTIAIRIVLFFLLLPSTFTHIPLHHFRLEFLTAAEEENECVEWFDIDFACEKDQPWRYKYAPRSNQSNQEELLLCIFFLFVTNSFFFFLILYV